MSVIPRLMLPMAAVLGVAVTLAACPFLPERDNFTCGIRAGDTITRCDGPGELCLCSDAKGRSNRCISPEDQRLCSSGFRYTFAEEEDGENGCVPEGSVTHYVTARSNAVCDEPGETECGSPGSDGTALRCGFNQFCFCPSLRCAEPWPACAADGGLPARLTATGECVGDVDGGLPAARERPNGICPGFLLEDIFPDGGS